LDGGGGGVMVTNDDALVEGEKPNLGVDGASFFLALISSARVMRLGMVVVVVVLVVLVEEGGGE